MDSLNEQLFPKSFEYFYFKATPTQFVNPPPRSYVEGWGNGYAVLPEDHWLRELSCDEVQALWDHQIGEELVAYISHSGFHWKGPMGRDTFAIGFTTNNLYDSADEAPTQAQVVEGAEKLAKFLPRLVKPQKPAETLHRGIRPAGECFELCDTIWPRDSLYGAFLKERTDIDKFVFYLWLDDHAKKIGAKYGIDKHEGNAGWGLKFIPRK